MLLIVIDQASYFYPFSPTDKMAKGKSNNANNNNNGNNTIAELKQQIAVMGARITKLEEANEELESKVDVLEGRLKISENVSEKLCIELDRLDQYHRRSNIIIKDVFLPEKETSEDVTKVVHKIISKDMGLPNLVPSIDKLHRQGKILEKNGKKNQNIIVRFKSHFARYSILKEKKKAKNVRLSANLTKRRGTLLFNASNAVKNIEGVHFCFANVHGDLSVRLNEPYDSKQVFTFNSMPQLSDFIITNGPD